MSKENYKKHKNYTKRLLTKEKRTFYSNLDLKNFTDNKRFWKTIKPLFSSSLGGAQKITLVKNNKIISSDAEVAETFCQFFKNSVGSLDIAENSFLKTATGNLMDPVQKALKSFEMHPSILDIKRVVKNETKFTFHEVDIQTIKLELTKLEIKKIGTYMNIPTKHLKQSIDIISEPLQKIWNNEIIDKMTFPSKLKLADITPVFKKTGMHK